MPSFPVYAESVGASLTVVGFIIASFGLVQFALRIPVGYFADRSGSRLPFIVIGLLANALGAIGMALFPHPILLVFWRGIHGIGAASYVTSTVYFAGFFRPDQAARAAGLLLFMASLSQVVISMAGGVLAERFGVPFTFWTAAVLAIVGIVGIFISGERAVVVHRPMSIARLKSVITIRSLITVSGISAIFHFVMFALNITFVPIFADGLGATDTDLGLITTVTYLFGGIAALLSVAGARLWSERGIVIIGGIFTALTILILPLIDTLSALLILQAVNSVARGLAIPVLLGIAIKVAPESERASAMGIYQCIYAIGMFSGPAVSGVIADWLGIEGLFLVMSIFPVVAVIVAIRWMPNDSSVCGTAV